MATWQAATTVNALIQRSDEERIDLEAEIEEWLADEGHQLELAYAWVSGRGAHSLCYFAHKVHRTPVEWSLRMSAIIHGYRNAYEIIAAVRRRSLVPVPATWPPRSDAVQKLEDLDNESKHQALPLTASAILGASLVVTTRTGHQVKFLPRATLAPLEDGSLVAEFDVTSVGGRSGINFSGLAANQEIGIVLPARQGDRKMVEAVPTLISFAIAVRRDCAPWLTWLEANPDRPSRAINPPFNIAGTVSVAKPGHTGASFFKRAGVDRDLDA